MERPTFSSDPGKWFEYLEQLEAEHGRYEEALKEIAALFYDENTLVRIARAELVKIARVALHGDHPSKEGD